MSRLDRQQQHRDANRRAILDAALELFVTHGYGEVSIRSIAAKADYSPAAIYVYFASKDDIFYALAEEGFRLLGATSMADAPPSDGPIADVRAMIWRMHEFSAQYPEYFALVFLDRRVPRIGQDYERFAFMTEMRARFLALITRAIQSGDLPATLHPRLAIRLLMAPVMGLAAMRLSRRLAPDEDPDAMARNAIDVTIAGLQAGAASHPFTAPGGDCFAASLVDADTDTDTELDTPARTSPEPSDV